MPGLIEVILVSIIGSLPIIAILSVIHVIFKRKVEGDK